MIKNLLSDKGLLTKEFFREVVRENKLEGTFKADERSRWLEKLHVDNKEEILFELEMYLKGVAYYFNLHNQPIVNIANIAGRDFLPELIIVKAAIERLITLCPKLHQSNMDNIIQFRQYLASITSHDIHRGRFLVEAMQQHSPEESLAVLLDGLKGFRALFEAIAKQSRCALPVFNAVGSIISRELMNNRFFSPFAILIYRPEYDRIESADLLESLRKVKPLEARREIIRILFAFFRLYRYISYLPSLKEEMNEGEEALKKSNVSSMIIFALLHAEINILASYLQAGIPERLSTWDRSESFIELCKEISMRMKGDIHRILITDLGKANKSSLGIQLPQSSAVSAAMIASLIEELIATIGRWFSPDLHSEKIFGHATVKRNQLIRLRKDLRVFMLLLKLFITDPETFSPDQLYQFLIYFRDVSYLLLPFGFHKSIDDFMAVFQQFRSSRSLNALKDAQTEAERLGKWLVSMFKKIDEREELSSMPLDKGAVQDLYNHYAFAEA